MASRQDFVGRIARLRRLTARRDVRVVLVVTVSAALVVSTWLAWRSLPADARSPSLGPVVVAMAITPIGLGLNAAELLWSAMRLRVQLSFWTAVRVSIYGSAANLLPIPGAAASRLAILVGRGAVVTRATSVTVGVGVAWVGVSSIVSGCALVVDRPVFGLVLVGAGALGLVASAGLAGVARRNVAEMGTLVAIEVGFTALITARLWLAGRALGFDVSIVDALVLSLASAAAAIVAFLPAGLGLREAIGAGLAGVTGLGIREGLVVMVLDRVVVLGSLAVIAGLVLTLAPPEAPVPEESEPDREP